MTLFCYVDEEMFTYKKTELIIPNREPILFSYSLRHMDIHLGDKIVVDNIKF